MPPVISRAWFLACASVPNIATLNTSASGIEAAADSCAYGVQNPALGRAAGPPEVLLIHSFIHVKRRATRSLLNVARATTIARIPSSEIPVGCVTPEAAESIMMPTLALTIVLSRMMFVPIRVASRPSSIPAPADCSQNSATVRGKAS